MADWVLIKVSGIPGVPDATFTVIVVVAKDTVEEAWRLPAICKEPLIVEEACETNPPDKVERLATNKVEEALRTPLTERLEEKVEEAVESRPLVKVPSPLKVAMPLLVRVFNMALLETTN